ncbi:transposase [Dactylosporangium sp. NPDC000244]|uniref:transposase n=1 Tax=Dactylosporangium sp. NPDC000244 TaxID=3154365 RepID=UPI0033171002
MGRQRCGPRSCRGDSAPRQRLIETELTERYGTTRFVLRNALTRLAGEGLVELQPNRGARVREISAAEAIEITEIRRAVEALVAARAAQRASPDDIAALRARGAAMTTAVEQLALRKAGRQRGIDRQAAEISEALHLPQLRQAPLVEDAMGRQALALLATLNAECDKRRPAHPDYEVITSFPGTGDLSGGRLLAEIGDDRARFTDARALKAYAGSAPVTRASGRTIKISTAIMSPRPRPRPRPRTSPSRGPRVCKSGNR